MVNPSKLSTWALVPQRAVIGFRSCTEFFSLWDDWRADDFRLDGQIGHGARNANDLADTIGAVLQEAKPDRAVQDRRITGRSDIALIMGEIGRASCRARDEGW